MEIKAYGLNNHPDISSFFDDYGVDNSDDLFDAFGNQAVDIDGVKAVCYYVEDDPDNIEMHILCDYWDHDTIKHTIANFLNSDLCESKKSEYFNPSDEFYRAKSAIDKWLAKNDVVSYEYDGATRDTYHGGAPKGDWAITWDTDNGRKRAVLHVGPYETKVNSFNDRIDLCLTADGLNSGKPMWYTSASDVLYALEEYVNDTLSGKAESKKSEAISPKLQLRKKFQAFDNLAKKLAFFRVSGKSAKDWYEGDYDSIGDFYDEESDAKEAAEKVFDDFDEYVDYRVDYDGSASELNYCPVFKFKPEFWELSVNDMSEVLAMLDDALQEYV